MRRSISCKGCPELSLLVSLFVTASGFLTRPQRKTGPAPDGDPDVTRLRLFDQDKFPFAKCLDGSPAGYFFKRGARQRHYLIHLQGGGECADPIRCGFLSKTGLGCSVLFPEHHSFRGDYVHVMKPHVVSVAADASTTKLNATNIAETAALQNTNATENPDFYDWNMVFVPYCSQDLWTGRRKQATADTFGMYFSGALIVDALVETLDTDHGMLNATSIVFSGNSAGGYGAHHHVDDVAAKHPLAETTGLAVGGLWGFSYPYRGAGRTINIFASFEKDNWRVLRRVWRAKVPGDCMGEHPGDKINCMVGCAELPYKWSFQKSRMFFAEASTDCVMLIYHNWIPPPPTGPDGIMDPNLSPAPQKEYLEEFMRNTTTCLRRGLKQVEQDGGEDSVGIFSPACFIHTNFPDRIKIEGRSFKEAFGDFVNKRGPTPKLIDEGFLSNPTCQEGISPTLI